MVATTHYGPLQEAPPVLYRVRVYLALRPLFIPMLHRFRAWVNAASACRIRFALLDVVVIRQRTLQRFSTENRIPIQESKEVLFVAEARSIDRRALLDDQRMWRLLLARLHPDIGGDHELFLFACAVKGEVCGGGHRGRKPVCDGGWQRTEPFLQAWQDAMDCWAMRNREALKIF
jgi:CDGSH-type Zn-finger protein